MMGSLPSTGITAEFSLPSTVPTKKGPKKSSQDFANSTIRGPEGLDVVQVVASDDNGALHFG